MSRWLTGRMYSTVAAFCFLIHIFQEPQSAQNNKYIEKTNNKHCYSSVFNWHKSIVRKKTSFFYD